MLTFDLTFLAPQTDWKPLEIELIFVEPEREEVAPKEEARDDTRLEQENVRDEVPERQSRTTASPRQKVAAEPQSPRSTASDLAEAKTSPEEKELESEEKQDRAESPQSVSKPPEPTASANVVVPEDTRIQEALLVGEVPGCEEGRNSTSPRTYIDEIAKSAKTGRSYSQAAVHAQINGYFRKAIDLYDAAILARDLSKNNLAKVYNNRGAAYRSLGFSGLAIDDYNEAMRLRPDYAAAYFNRGVAYSLNDQKERAIDDFTRSIRLDSGFANPYYHRGVIYAQQAKHKQAISDFSRAIQLAPCLDYAYFDRGRALESRGDLRRAIDDFKKSYALNPSNQEYKAKLLSLSSP